MNGNAQPGLLRESLGYGFRTVKQHPWLLCKAVLTLLFAFVLPAFVLGVIVAVSIMSLLMPPIAQIALVIIALTAITVVFYGAWAGMIRFALQLHDEGKAEIKTLFTGFRYAGRFFLVTLLIGFLAAIPTALIGKSVKGCLAVGCTLKNLSEAGSPAMLLIGMGIYLIVVYFIFRMILAPYIIVDQQSGVIASLKRSWQYTQGWMGWRILGTLMFLYIAMGVPGGLLDRGIDKLFVKNSDAYIIAQIAVGLLNVIMFIAFELARIKLYRIVQDKTLPASRFSF